MEVGTDRHGLHHRLPRSSKGHDSIWVIVGRLTKVAHFIPVRTTYRGDQLADLYMSRIICLHRVLKEIVSDRGTQFTSRFCKKVHEHYGSKWEDCLSYAEFSYNKRYQSSWRMA